MEEDNSKFRVSKHVHFKGKYTRFSVGEQGLFFI